MVCIIEIAFVQEGYCVCVCVRVCMCPPPRALITTVVQKKFTVDVKKFPALVESSII